MQRSSESSSARRRHPRIKGQCSVCESVYGIHTHHIDWNHDNNEKSNLTTLCHYCHEQAHKLGKPLFDKLRHMVVMDKEVRWALRSSSMERHRELYGPTPEVSPIRMFK